MTPSRHVLRTPTKIDTKLAVHVTSYLFLVTCSIVIGKAVRDALFLSHFTVIQMTRLDLEAVLPIVLVIGAYLCLQHFWALRTVLVASLAGTAFVNLACWWALHTCSQPWITKVIYLWIGIEAVIMPSQVSVLVRQAFDLRQTKQLVGLMGTGGVLGWIAGGFVTQMAAACAETQTLLLVMAVLAAICPVCVLRVWRLSAPAGPRAGHIVKGLPPIRSLFQSAAVVWQSAHLWRIACLVMVSTAASTIAGLQFKAIARQEIVGTDALAIFFGAFTFKAGIVALAIQLLTTSKVLQRLGIGPALAVAPLALTTGSIGVLASGTLGAAVLLKGSDQVLKYSIDRSAYELLYAPLTPTELLPAKTFIEAVIYRIGDAAGGLTAMLGMSLLHLRVTQLSAISLCMLVGWLVCAQRARRSYLDAIRHNLCRASNTAAASGAGGSNKWPKARLDSRPPGALRALVDDVCEADPLLRHAILRALKGLPKRNPDAAFGKPSVERELVATEARAWAIEYLDNTLTPRRRKALIPLLETYSGRLRA